MHYWWWPGTESGSFTGAFPCPIPVSSIRRSLGTPIDGSLWRGLLVDQEDVALLTAVGHETDIIEQKPRLLRIELR